VVHMWTPGILRRVILVTFLLLTFVLLFSPGCTGPGQTYGSGGVSSQDPQSPTDRAYATLTRAQLAKLERDCSQSGVPGTSRCATAVERILRSQAPPPRALPPQRALRARRALPQQHALPQQQAQAPEPALYVLEVRHVGAKHTRLKVSTAEGRQSCDAVAPDLCQGVTLNERVALPETTAAPTATETLTTTSETTSPTEAPSTATETAPTADEAPPTQPSQGP
jgi:hypothetical protein